MIFEINELGNVLFQTTAFRIKNNTYAKWIICNVYTPEGVVVVVVDVVATGIATADRVVAKRLYVLLLLNIICKCNYFLRKE